MRRRLLLNLLPRPLLILQVQLDLVLVHCPSINGDNPEGETNKQTNKQAEVAHAEAWMQGAVQSCIACGVWCAICQSTWRSFGDALEMYWKSAEFDTQGHTLTMTHPPLMTRAVFGLLFLPFFLGTETHAHPHYPLSQTK